MAKKESIKKITKKKTRDLVFEKLSTAMNEFKADINEKKLNAELKKISKNFAEDILKASKKKQIAAKKTAKKVKAKKTGSTPSEVTTA